MRPLIPQIISWATLLMAWEHVRENDGGPGADGISSDRFQISMPESLRTLQQELLEARYHPRPLLRVYVPKASGGTRPLSIPTMRDRVAQTAAALVMGPLLDQEFEISSFGYRRGRSVRMAVSRIKRLRKSGYRWVLDADIDQFFDNVNHDRLLARLRESIYEEPVIQLIKQWIKGKVKVGRRLLRISKGIPQGSPLSPILANLYLDRFDEEVENKGFQLVRYADDFLVFCRDEKEVQSAFRLVGNFLKKLHLTLDPNKTRVANFEEGFHFLGWFFLGDFALPWPKRLARR